MSSFPSFPTPSACSIHAGMPARRELSYKPMGCSADPPPISHGTLQTGHKGKEGAKENVVSPSFLYLEFLLSVFNALFPGPGYPSVTDRLY